MSVVVAITTGTAQVSRLELLREIFDDPYYKVIIVDFNTLPPCSRGYDIETKTTLAALRRIEESYPDLPSIVIADTVVPTASRQKVKKIVRQTLAKVRDFDLLYMSRFDDACQLLAKTEPIEELKYTTPAIMKTLAPSGVFAVLYSVHGRQVVLGQTPMANGHNFVVHNSLSNNLREQIFAGNIQAICTVPNLFEYDIVLNTYDNADYLRVNECQVVAEPVQPVPEKNRLGVGGVFGFLLIILVILIIGWALIRLGPGGDIKSAKKKTEEDRFIPG